MTDEPRSRLRDRIAVEPLDGGRLDRLEQRIVAEARPLLARPRRSPWTPWLLAGTAALAAAALVIVVGSGGQGGARPAGPVVVATDTQGTRVDLGDAVVAVGPDTRFEVLRARGGLDLVLARGDITLEVPPRHARPPLWVHAGDVGVRVVGTGFRVHRGDTVEVEVSHGAVEIHRGEALARVATGERWSSTDGAVVAIAALSIDRAHRGRAPTGTATPIAAATTIPIGGLALSDNVGGPGLRDRRMATVPGDASTPGAAGATSKPVERIRRDRATPPTVTAPALRPLLDLRAEIMAQPLGTAPALPAGATATVVTAEARAELLRRVAMKNGADAAGALWGLAYLQATDLRNDAGALRSLDLYVRRFPSGPHTEQILWLRLRLLCKRGLDAPCRVAAHAYVARFPGTVRGDLAVRVTNTR